MSISLSYSALTPRRVDTPELLDAGAGTTADVQQSLRDLWRINRFFGGIIPLTRPLFPRLLKHTQPVTLVDLGTGSAQLPALIARWAKRRQRKVTIYGVDFAKRHLNIAQEHVKSVTGVHLIQADVLQFPFAANSVDYFISSLFFHHFTPDQVIYLLRQAFKSARYGLIISDLERGWLPLAAFKSLQPILARSYLTRHDGVASIRRAYTPTEFREMAQAAGLTNIKIYRYFPWRMTLVAEK